MWSLPGPEIEPVSPSLTGEFLSTVPSGNSYFSILIFAILEVSFCHLTFLLVTGFVFMLFYVFYASLHAWFFFIL